MARARGQALSQMALAWVLRHAEVTSALVGASRVAQVESAVGALEKRSFTADELQSIEQILAS
jgi:L-glyceraldehyde 3-phosphate reductase